MYNKVRAKLSGKKILIGSTLMLGSTRVTEIMARSGFDFLMVDLQHGPFDKASATDSIRALAVSETGAFARVAENSPGRINDLLDAGALGIVVPMVNSPEEAAAAVAATFYPPRGQRSKGGSATAVYGDDYDKWANDEILLMVMIETARAVERVDEILAVPGLDMCLVGTSDLSLDMNCPRDDERIRDAIGKVVAAGHRHGVSVGTAIGNVADIAKWQCMEPSFYLISHDHGLLKEASRRLAADLQQAIGREEKS